MALTDDFIIAATDMFSEFGVPCTIKRYVKDTFDIEAGEYITSEDTVDCTVIYDQKKSGGFIENSYEYELTDNKLLVLVDENEFVFITDIIEIDGIDYSIKAMEETKSELQTIFYTIMVRRKDA